MPLGAWATCQSNLETTSTNPAKDCIFQIAIVSHGPAIGNPLRQISLPTSVPKEVRRPPPLDWTKVVLGVVTFAFLLAVIGVGVDVWTKSGTTTWSYFLGAVGAVCPLTAGMYLRLKHPATFDRFLRFFEALGNQKDEEAPGPSASAQGAHSRAAAATASGNARQLVVQGDYYAGPPPPTVTMQPREPNRTRARASTAKRTLVDAHVTIGPGEYESWRLEVGEDDHLRGTVEADGTVNVLMLHEEAYERYVEEDDYEPENALGEDKRFVAVNFPVRGEGVWYLVVEVYGKQNPREVHVVLKHQTLVDAD